MPRAALVAIDGTDTVLELSTREATALGELVDTGRVEAVLVPHDAGWMLHASDPDGFVPAVQPLEHGSSVRIGHRVWRFLCTDDLARALEDERYLATVLDPATDTFNRRFLRNHAHRIAAPAAVLLVDLDLFKRHNDTYGMMMGDHLLRTVARRLAAHVRAPELLVRYGGEEFAIVLPGCEREAALDRAERLRAAVEPPIVAADVSVVVTISLGVAVLAPGEAFDDAFRRADDNLGRAKTAGRNRVVG